LERGYLLAPGYSIRRESQLFARWQQRCGLSLSLLQQLVTNVLSAVLRLSHGKTCCQCPHSVHSRVYEAARCPSVRPSVCPTAANPPLQICCCGPGGQEKPIDRCSSGVRRENAGSGALSAYVGSWRHSCLRRSGRGDVETDVRCTKWTASTDRSFESAALVTNSVATTSPFLPPKTRTLARSAR